MMAAPTTNEKQFEEVFGLLHKAQEISSESTTNLHKKQELLIQSYELIFGPPSSSPSSSSSSSSSSSPDPAPPSSSNVFLIGDLLPDFLLLNTDPHPQIRKFVLRIIEEAIKVPGLALSPSLLESCKDTLLNCAKNENTGVCKMAVQVATRVWPFIHAMNASKAEDFVGGMLDVWKETSFAAIRLHVVKFLEMVALRENQKNSDSLVEILTSHLPSASSTSTYQMSTVVAIIQSLHMIAKRKHHHISLILRSLEGFHLRMRVGGDCRSFFSESVVKSIHYALYLCFQYFRKSRLVPQEIRRGVSVFQRLDGYVQELQKSLSSSSLKRKHDEAYSRSNKRPRTEVPSHPRDRERREGGGKLVGGKILDELSALIQSQAKMYKETPPQIVDFIILNMAAASSVHLEQLKEGVIGGEEQKLEEKKQEQAPEPVIKLTPAQIKEQGLRAFLRTLYLRPEKNHVNAIFLRRGLAVRLAKGGVGLGGGDPKGKEPEGKEEELLGFGDEMMKYLGENPWARRELLLQWLNQLLSSCLDCCSAEDPIEDNCEKYNDVLLQIMDQTVGRLAGRDEEEKEDGVGEGEEGDDSMVAEKKIEHSPEFIGHFFRFLLREAPLLTSSIFDYLEELLTSPETFSIGLESLEEIVLHRSYEPDWTKALKIILELTEHQDSQFQEISIRVICTKIWPAEIDVLCQKIKNFSSSLISSLLNLDLSPFSSSSSSSSSIVKKEEPEGVKEEEMDNMETEEGEKEALITEVRRLTFLYFSLMREGFVSFRSFLEVYCKGGEELQKILFNEITELASTTTFHDSTLLSLLSPPPPPGAEQFILDFFLLVSGDSTPSPPPPFSHSVVNALLALSGTDKKKKKDRRDRERDRDRENHSSFTPCPQFLLPILLQLEIEDICDFLHISLEHLSLAQLKTAVTTLLNSHKIAATTLLVELVRAGEGEEERVKKCCDVVDFCLKETDGFGSRVMASVVQQLGDVSPWPQLFMRLVILTTTKYPQLMDHVIQILLRKRIWTDPRLWKGFVVFCMREKKYSMPLICNLPHDDIVRLLKDEPKLVDPVTKYYEENQDQQDLTHLKRVIASFKE